MVLRPRRSLSLAIRAQRSRRAATVRVRGGRQAAGRRSHLDRRSGNALTTVARTSRSAWAVADDGGAHHPADRWKVVLDRVVLGGAVVPDDERVGGPVQAHLVFGDGRLAQE